MNNIDSRVKVRKRNNNIYIKIFKLFYLPIEINIRTQFVNPDTINKNFDRKIFLESLYFQSNHVKNTICIFIESKFSINQEINYNLQQISLLHF